ncbi:helix-turn-helix domain-containing protein [Streptomyces rimosus]|uniref:hypothetical protein n=1 Tax=Streptomyces rimosus TaxID=1927 RepID=UPI0004C1F11D|nr:hypothetical protein [Streptomyces rimosus]
MPGPGRPSTLPTASEIFRLLAKGTYKTQKEIADAYGVSESAVSHALAPYKEGKIDYRAIMPWDVLPKHLSNPRPARALRLHLRAQLEYHTLTAEEEAEHESWIASLKSRTLHYDQSGGWVYVTRIPEHGDLVVLLPKDVELPAETVDLYRMTRKR